MMTYENHLLPVVPARDAKRTAEQRAGLLRAVDELRRRTSWHPKTAHFECSWVVGARGCRWRVTAFTSLFFEEAANTFAVFHVGVEPTASDPLSVLGRAQIAWFQRLRDRLGERYRTLAEDLMPDPVPVQIPYRREVTFGFRGDSDPSRVLREFDHATQAIDGVRRSTRSKTQRRRMDDGQALEHDLLAISSAVVSTGGPWHLTGLRFTSDVRARHAGDTWVVSASMNPTISGATATETEQHGFGAFLFVWAERDTKVGVPGRWGWFRDTKQEMTQAGYEFDPRGDHFRRFVPTLRLATFLRELKRIEGRLTAAQG